MIIWKWKEFSRCDKFPTTPVLDLPTPEGWKAELTLVLVMYQNGLPVRRQSPV